MLADAAVPLSGFVIAIPCWPGQRNIVASFLTRCDRRVTSNFPLPARPHCRAGPRTWQGNQAHGPADDRADAATRSRCSGLAFAQVTKMMVPEPPVAWTN